MTVKCRLQAIGSIEAEQKTITLAGSDQAAGGGVPGVRAPFRKNRSRPTLLLINRKKLTRPAHDFKYDRLG